MPKLTKVIKEKYEAKLDFPGGWGFKPKNLLWGVYEYFLEVHTATLPTGQYAYNSFQLVVLHI